MKKNSGPRTIRLSRETLLRLDHEQLRLPQGGGAGTTSEAASCGYTYIPCGSVKCSITGCGDC